MLNREINHNLIQMDEHELIKVNGGGPTGLVIFGILAVSAIAGFFTGCQEEKRAEER